MSGTLIVAEPNAMRQLRAVLSGTGASSGQVWTAGAGDPAWETPASGASGAVFDYEEAFDLVTGQADYVWGAGTQRVGDITGGARTDAASAVVQWGVGLLAPTLDYSILSDRIRLVSTPSAEQAASGQPLVVRVKRAP